MYKIYFENSNKSPLTFNAPLWQEEIIKRINAEYCDEAIEISAQIQREFEKIQKRIQPGYYAIAFDGILQKVPRYAYIKNINDGFGRTYEAQIDLAFHTVLFIEVTE